MASFDIPLRGPGGEPVDLWRTLVSHGVASLPPMFLDEEARTLTVTVRAGLARPRTVTIASGRRGFASVAAKGSAPRALEKAVRHILALDRDLSGFYDGAKADPEMSWAAAGSGRMIQSETVFEDVVKTICTTNCAWSATQRMVGALVTHLGEPAPGAPAEGAAGRAFPTPQAMASAGEAWYRDVARAGYRGRSLMELSTMVADGSVDLEALAADEDRSDDELAAELRALPGVGPYAAAHIMLMIGRSSRLILDSWTRPTYARLLGKKLVKDTTIERRFRRYGEWAGLAFWLFVTRDWVDEPPPVP
jgi:3-methyladenine DNA glycosylase/8-oxoguanine DNA glycosylase